LKPVKKRIRAYHNAIHASPPAGSQLITASQFPAYRRQPVPSLSPPPGSQLIAATQYPAYSDSQFQPIADPVADVARFQPVRSVGSP